MSDGQGDCGCRLLEGRNSHSKGKNRRKLEGKVEEKIGDLRYIPSRGQPRDQMSLFLQFHES